MRFELATATRIVFGAGAIDGLVAIAADLGRRALLVTGRDPARAAGPRAALEAAGLLAAVTTTVGEPTVPEARAAVAAARAAGCDVVVALGGGSALDLGKAVAALLANGGDPLDYLEVVGRGQPLLRPSLPLVAIPTTAGTGAEVTRNAVLAVPEARVKASLRSAGMLPRVALVDPDLTRDMPPAVTASTGMDALAQLVEPFVSLRANPLTDAFCREGMGRAARALPRAFADGHDRTAREDMALASLLGGLALANAGLGLVHGFAAVVGGLFPAPHGAVCGRLLAPVMRANLAALGRRAPDAPAVARYAEVARHLTGDESATADDGVAAVGALAETLRLPRLSAFGLVPADVPGVVAKARAASSTKANPILLDDDEMATALAEAL